MSQGEMRMQGRKEGGRAVQGMADVENRLGMGMSALLRRDLPKLYKPIQRPRSKF